MGDSGRLPKQIKKSREDILDEFRKDVFEEMRPVDRTVVDKEIGNLIVEETNIGKANFGPYTTFLCAMKKKISGLEELDIVTLNKFTCTYGTEWKPKGVRLVELGHKERQQFRDAMKALFSKLFEAKRRLMENTDDE